MRLLLSLAWSTVLVGSAFAQVNFDPYRAALLGMSLDETRPLLETRYPNLVDVAQQLDPALAEAGIVLLYDNDPVKPSTFLFCQNRLAGFSAILPPGDAATIIGTLTMPDNPPTETYASANGVTIRYPGAEVSVQYWGIATPDSYVGVNYPIMNFTAANLAKRCKERASLQ